MNKRLIIILFFAFTVQTLNAQDSLKTAEFLPDIDGVIKTKFEADLENHKERFDVRNARFGARGKINPYFSYRVEVDLCDEGQIKMLDAYVKINPIKNLDIYLGQRKVPFGTDYLRNPAENFFANRSFVSKYTNNGLRDMGFVTSYKSKWFIPFEIWAGAMNGSGSNNPQWQNRPSYSSRLVLGDSQGLSFKGNFYMTENDLEENLIMHGLELCYTKKKFLIETEFIQRDWKDTSGLARKSNAMYLHSWYAQPVKSKLIKYIMPTARYDLMGNDINANNISAERMTIGVNLGFDTQKFQSEIRLNYENYYKGTQSSHFDKFTVEFVGRF